MAELFSNLLWNSGSALALGSAICCISRFSTFQRRPALLHLLWFGVLGRLIIPSVVPIPILPGTPLAMRTELQTAGVLLRNPLLTIEPTRLPPAAKSPARAPVDAAQTRWILPMLLLLMSLSGTAALFVRSLCRLRRISRLLEESHDPPARLVELAEAAAQNMNIAVMPRVRLVNGLASPSIWMGPRDATILLPRHLVDVLDDGQWSCILAHELAHLSRRDHWFNVAGSVVLLLQWWNPIAWWAWREMQAQQEASCDAMAISQSPRSRRVYAETLLQVVEAWNERSFVQPQVLLGFGNRTVLTRRFEMIANSSVRPKVTTLASLCVALGALAFVCVPVRAEKGEPTAEEIQVMKEMSRNNLKQIMLAFHNYHDVHNSFPPRLLFGKDNKGGQFPHSWRVALLPFLDRKKLYDQYQFDEAWDSEANKKVLAQIPDVFMPPGADQGSTDTAYFVFVGKLQDDDSQPNKLESLFSSKTGTRMMAVRDGTSNTLAIIETKRDGKDAIPWTQPRDIDYDPAKALPKLGGWYKDGFFVGIADGSVRLAPSTIPEATVKELISPASGNITPAF